MRGRHQFRSAAPLGIDPGKTVGVVGIGGLGHLGVKFAPAMGAHVVAFTTSISKIEEALELGAHDAVISTDAEALTGRKFGFDFILDTISVTREVDPYLAALHYNGVLRRGHSQSVCAVTVSAFRRRRSLSGCGAGGSREIKEMLDFCATHKIVADVEIFGKSQINDALDRLRRNDVRFRFVPDLNRP